MRTASKGVKAMLTLTLRYGRYALATLTTVAFALTNN